ncbi:MULTISPECIES: hypothetical protein [unclassified Candidatus Tisiphia]|uniref:hypothetical protein n=1 Tax=unclassified Candidatus Tisiphia TaxID=2996318 RepID=UPI00312CAEAB
MSKAKTASKNNPTSREQTKEYFHNGQKIKPVKLISGKFSFLAAEYDASGDLVIGSDGKALPWDRTKI